MKTLVLITAFNVEKFLEDVVKRIPKEIKSYNPEILIINDFSSDNTLQKMREIRDSFRDFKITCLSNKTNLGYGGNQKIGYHYAIKNNFDYVVMLHGDGQYDPSLINLLLEKIDKNFALVNGFRDKKAFSQLEETPFITYYIFALSNDCVLPVCCSLLSLASSPNNKNA